MTTLNRVPQKRFSGCATVVAVLCILAAQSAAIGQEEHVGSTKQAIVAGQLVSPDMEEEYGLLSLNDRCSASLLTNEWVITAAHCLDPADLMNPAGVSLTAAWNSDQIKTAKEIRTFGPKPDIAIIRVSEPFMVLRSTKGYERRLLGNEIDDLNGSNLLAFGRGINTLAQGSGPAVVPAMRDGLYRWANVKVTTVDQAEQLAWYPRNSQGQIIAGGDSGGPSFVNTWNGRVLFGVHSICNTQCALFVICLPKDWTYIAAISACGDAPVATVRSQIMAAIARPAGPPPPDSETRGPDPPPLAPFGPVTGSDTLAHVYGISRNGALHWYQHNAASSGHAAWQPPRIVGRGWSNFQRVFSGGSNVIYAITPDGTLRWYKHNGAWDGKGLEDPTAWEGPRDVAKGWGDFQHVFSMGEGVIYTITKDGTLQWWRHNSYKSGGGQETAGAWDGPRNVGIGWNNFKQVFSAGSGTIYAITADGTLRWYRHTGYTNGRGLESADAWLGPRDVARGWSEFRWVFSPGNGIIYAVDGDGSLRWYKHKVFLNAMVITSVGKGGKSLAWEGPTTVGSGWQNLVAAFALLPGTPDVVR